MPDLILRVNTLKPMALRLAKTVNNFGLSGSNRVKFKIVEVIMVCFINSSNIVML